MNHTVHDCFPDRGLRQPAHLPSDKSLRNLHKRVRGCGRCVDLSNLREQWPRSTHTDRAVTTWKVTPQIVDGRRTSRDEQQGTCVRQRAFVVNHIETAEKVAVRGGNEVNSRRVAPCLAEEAPGNLYCAGLDVIEAVAGWLGRPIESATV